MSNPTTYYGWQMPEPTSLVTDLPADFEVFGQAVDTDFQDLLGGTTGQILSKTSATDLDFTWVTPNAGDITGVTAGTGISGGGTSGTVTVTNSMATAIDAKGDLIVGTGADAFSRLAVGATNGHVLTVDSAEATGLKYAAVAGGSNFVALNGAGTSLTGASTSITGLSGYDKYYVYIYNASATVSATHSFTFNSDTTSKYGGDALRLTSSGSAINIVGLSFTGLNGDTSISLGGPDASQAINSTLVIQGANSSGAKITTQLVGVTSSSGNYADLRTTIYTGTSVISSIQIKVSSGSFNGGTVFIYGSA